MKKGFVLFLSAVLIFAVFSVSATANENVFSFEPTPEESALFDEFFETEKDLLKTRNCTCDYEICFRVFIRGLWTEAVNCKTDEEYLDTLRNSTCAWYGVEKTRYAKSPEQVYSGPVLFAVNRQSDEARFEKLEKHMPLEGTVPYAGPLAYGPRVAMEYYVDRPYAFFSADMESEHAALFALYPEVTIREVYYQMGSWEMTGTPGEYMIVYVTDQGAYVLLRCSEYSMYVQTVSEVFDAEKTYLMPLGELLNVARPIGEKIRAEDEAEYEQYLKELEKHDVVPPDWETQSVSYEVDYDGLVQAALEKKAAQSVSAENGAEPKDAAPVGAPQTPAVVELTTGEEPESSNALTWIFGGAGAAVLAAAVIGWIWIRTRKRNESR